MFDSVSVATTFKAELAKAGVLFMPISEALQEHPDLVKKYLGTVVPISDNFFATLNSAVFSDGSFVYVPPGVRCPMELSTYFRINERNTGQFERTLIIADKGSYVSYLEGCTAPMRDENQLHAAVVELIALDDAEIKYSTIQNWYPGDAAGRGGIYNFVTKRGDCRGKNAKISWTQVETGSAITWKYPSCILRGDNSRGEFYSIAISNGYQQVDSGTKMLHLGKNTTSRIISKGIAAGHSNNTYRGLVTAHRRATGARNFTNCDSLLIGDQCGAHTVPYIEAKNSSTVFEHEATTSKISEEMLFYCRQRGLSAEEAVALVVNGFVKDVLQQLPMEFAVEAQKLISVSLEGSVGSSGPHPYRGPLRGHLEGDDPGRLKELVILRCEAEGRASKDARSQKLSCEMPLLEIKNLHVEIDGKEILKGLDLAVNAGEVHAIMGPNGSGKSTLAYVLAGKAGYEPTAGEVLLQRQEPVRHGAGRARRRRPVPRLPISAGNSRRRHHDVPAHRAQRAAQEARRGGAVDAGIPQEGARGRRQARHRSGDAAPRASMSASPAARRSATRSCRWRCSSRGLRCSTRPIPASTSTRCKIVSDGVNRLRSPSASFVVITHYQRLLNYIVPDVVHVLSNGPHRADRRQGVGAGARGARLCANIRKRRRREPHAAAHDQAETNECHG